MLTVITKDTSVLNDQQVIATNARNIVKVGFLIKDVLNSNYSCIHEGGLLHNVTHFITVNNFLKIK
jgi:hypothetical protein